jgi:transcriptional regulator with XRE-family HTH domain
MGQRLKEAREKAGLTQTKLAELLDINPAEISQYESDKRTPRWDKFNKILDILDITADYLLGREISVVSDDNDYHVKMSKKDILIIQALRINTKLYNLLQKDPERNAKAINNNLKRVFPE